MHQPIAPDWSRERKRLRLHNDLMARGAKHFGVRLDQVCPDCYAPVPWCFHIRREKRHE